MRWTLSMRWLAGGVLPGLMLACAAGRAADAVAPADTATVLQDHVNVRARAGTGSEVIAQLRKGQHVIILEEIPTASARGTNSASGWYKIALTNQASAWVSRLFVSSNRVVIPKSLNLRSGPGEEFQLLGRINKGTRVKVEETKGDWLRIETGKPTYGYVAASLVRQQPITIPASPAVAATVPPAAPTRRTPPPARVTPVPSGPPVVTEVTPNTPPPPASATGNPVPIALTPPPTAESAPPVVVAPPATVAAVAPPVVPPAAAPVVEPAAPPVIPPAVVAAPGAGSGTNLPVLPPVSVPMPSSVPPPGVDVHVDRLVAREGTLRAAINIQAPAYHELLSVHSGKVINYLYTTNIDLKPFRGKRVIVSGREYLDRRWLLTPVLVVDTLETVPNP